MNFDLIPFLVSITAPPPSGGGVEIHGMSHAGPSGFGSTLVFSPPAGMQAGDQLVMVGYWDATFSTSDVGTFTDITPASWLSAPSTRRILVSNSFGSVPSSITLTFSGGGLHEYSVWAVSGVSTSAVLSSGVGTTSSAAGARDHAYSTGSANSLAIGFIDFTDGSVTGVGSADGAHTWDLTASGGYQSAFAAVRVTAGSYAASLAPVGASSGSEYGWAEIGGV